LTDQIKISASLQEAQLYMAECLEFVTQDEAFVLDFIDSHGSYVQAVRDSREQVCVEISGPESIEGELAPEVADKLVKLGWGLPRQPEADTPNFWREYPEDADLQVIAKDTILGVAVAFPDANFELSDSGESMSLDETLKILNSGTKTFLNPITQGSNAGVERALEANGFVFAGHTIESGNVFAEKAALEEFAPASREPFYSAWKNYQAASFRCSTCKKNFPGDSLESDFQGLVLTLRCPKCHRKLVHLSVEATNEQIERFAAEGSPIAIEHLEMMAARKKETGTEKGSE
jgi:DNA-directed RNA polymerase subunit RPC12/RpoP